MKAFGRHLQDRVSYGEHYLPAANCHFYGDEPDSIAGTENTANSVDELDSEITLATTKYGGKDPGQDIDVFYVDMIQDVEYEVHIEGLDPTSEDARLALNELRYFQRLEPQHQRDRANE